VQLAAVTLVPTSADRTPLTPEGLRDLLISLRRTTDRVEHVKVIERAGMLWVAAYVSVPEVDRARVSLQELVGRLTGIISGWELVEEPESLT
jgi:hypothetical protein